MSSEQVGGSHYSELKPEPLEVMRDWLGEEGYHAYLLGNVIKYIARYPKKNGIEDLRKAEHYLRLRLEGEMDTRSDISDRSSIVSRSWVGDQGYECHIRATIIESIGNHFEDNDHLWWLYDALYSIRGLISLLQNQHQP